MNTFWERRNTRSSMANRSAYSLITFGLSCNVGVIGAFFVKDGFFPLVFISCIILYIANTLIFDIKDRYENIVIKYDFDFTPKGAVLVAIILIAYWALTIWSVVYQFI